MRSLIRILNYFDLYMYLQHHFVFSSIQYKV